MPGPIKNAGATRPSPDSLIVAAVEIPDETLECPSTEGYVSQRMYRTRTADGVIELPEWYWTKKGLARWLTACPKVSVYIELDRSRGQTNAATAPDHVVGYDGYGIPVPVGRRVMVALPIAQIIQNMQTEYRTAGSKGIDLYRIDPNNPDDYGYEIPALAAVAG